MVERIAEIPVPVDAACDAAMIARYGQAAEFIDHLVTASSRSDQDLVQRQIDGLEQLGLDVNIGL